VKNEGLTVEEKPRLTRAEVYLSEKQKISEAEVDSK